MTQDLGAWSVNAGLFDYVRSLPADEAAAARDRLALGERAMRAARSPGLAGQRGDLARVYDLRGRGQPARRAPSLDTGATSRHFRHEGGILAAAWRLSRLSREVDADRGARLDRAILKDRMALTLDRAADSGRWVQAIGHDPTGMPVTAGGWLRGRAYALRGCRGAVGFREATCGWTLARPLSCRVRGCPDCERARAARVVNIYAEAAARMAHPAMLTVTIRNVPATLDGLRDGLATIRAGWEKLQRRAIFRGTRCKSWRSRHNAAWLEHGNRADWPGHDPVLGGLSSVEVTYNADTDTFHPHLHALVDVRWLDQRELSDAWRDLTGSYIVHIKRVRPGRDGKLRSALVEVLKYVAKPSEHLLDEEHPDRLAAVLVALRGRRLVTGFGSLFGVELDPDEDDDDETTVLIPDPHDPFRSYRLPATCPYCGQEALWEPPVAIERADCRRPPPARAGVGRPPLAYLPPPPRTERTLQ